MDECAPTPDVNFVTMQRKSLKAIKQVARAQLRRFTQPRAGRRTEFFGYAAKLRQSLAAA